MDYLLDESALSLLKLMAASFKMNGHHIARNEVAILGMVKKWADSKGRSAVSQAVIGPYFVDLLIDSNLVIEFDEPHHGEKGRVSADRARSDYLVDHGMDVLWFDLAADVVDITLCIEDKLIGKSLPGSVARANREVERAVIFKAKDFASEITMFDARVKMLGGEEAILDEHVASSEAVC